MGGKMPRHMTMEHKLPKITDAEKFIKMGTKNAENIDINATKLPKIPAIVLPIY